MNRFSTILLFFVCLNSFAQKEANTWYFGENAGLDFNSGEPVAINDGRINTREGCSSISDADGNLLFYSDGTTVWNKNHIAMPNGIGLKGHSSSTQSAMIIPKPGDETQYYLFTVGVRLGNSGEFGLHYYTIDMTAQNGLGDIIEGPISLSRTDSQDWSEKVAAIKGKECNTYWVLSYKLPNEFVAYKIDVNGVNSTPVRTRVFAGASDRRGYLKIAPDGSKVAIAHMNNQALLVYKFDNSSGKLSNEIFLNLQAPNNNPYGVEFSGSGEKLYVHASNDFYDEDPIIWNNPNNHTSSLYQFNLKNYNRTEIQNSRFEIDNQNLYRGALQLGSDQRIYRALASTYNIGKRFLGVINDPEKDGLECDYEDDTIDLGFRNSSQGLPPFIASFFYQIEITNNENNDEVITNKTISLCTGSDYTFQPESLDGQKAIYSWTLNDELIKKGLESTLYLEDINSTDSGMYKLEVEIEDDCEFDVFYKGNFEVEVYDPPVVLETYIYDQCDVDENSLDGVTIFNLNSKSSEITNGDTDLMVTFYSSETALNNNDAILNSSLFVASNNSELIIKVTNINSGCFSTSKLELNVFPTSLEEYDTIYACENDEFSNDMLAVNSNGTGQGTFNFEQKRQEIIDLFSVSDDVIVDFYQSQIDAQLQTNEINGILDLESQEIFVRISNKETSGCISIGKFNIVVNLLPIPTGNEENQILCVSNPKDSPPIFFIELNSYPDNASDNFQWFHNDNLIAGANEPTFKAFHQGNYRVEVTRNYEFGSTCATFANFFITESNIPILNNSFLDIQDDSDNNSIEINNDLLGIGDYEFALDSPYEDFQDEPYFENVAAGIHTVYVRDKNYCGMSSLEISVIGFPRFFTPNNDGYNDTWQVIGVNEKFYSASDIYIFDRFGKLLAQIDPKNSGWDGYFNGKLLPSSDYWFSVELKDSEGNSRFRKGHFSLIRR